MKCAHCAHEATTTVPVIGAEHVCATHASEFWRGVVTVGAALAEVTRHVQHSIRFEPPPNRPQYARLCRCGAMFVTHREHGFVCPSCVSASRSRGGGASGVSRRKEETV